MSGHEDFRLPPGWEEKSISQVTIKTRQRDPRRTPHQKFRYVDVSSISRELFKITSPTELLGAEAPSRARKEIQENDVLFATVRPTLRRIAIVPTELNGEIASTGYCVLRSDLQQLDPRFLYFYLLTDHFNSRMAGLERGASYPAVSDSDVTNSPIPLPPLPEQKAISHSLSAVQRAIEAQERIIQTTTELKQALMQKLFSEGVRGEPQKMTEIGLVPESWELAPIGELFDTQLGKMLSQKAKVGHRPKPYLRNKNVQWGRIDTDDLLTMDFNDTESEKFLLKKGDLLVCEGGEVGRAAIWQGQITECYYQKALHRLRPKHARATNEFMAYWMMHAFLLSNAYGITGTRTTIAHLPEIKLQPLLIPIPSIDERDEIVSLLDFINLKFENHRRKLSQLQDLFSTLLHDLMTAKTQVRNAAFKF